MQLSNLVRPRGGGGGQQAVQLRAQQLGRSAQAHMSWAEFSPTTMARLTQAAWGSPIIDGAYVVVAMGFGCQKAWAKGQQSPGDS